jgi:hypothetical protein
MSRAAIAEPVELVDPTGARRSLTLTPAGHVALFVRALHAPAATALRERTGQVGLVEACAVTRGRDGRPRPHRSGRRAHFLRCGDVAKLQALAQTTRAGGRECWCSVAPRTERVAGGKAVPGGALLWADVDTAGTLWRARALRDRLPLRLVVESGGAASPGEERWHLYLGVSRWLAADELEVANARLAELLGGDRVGDRGRLMRVPGTYNLKSGRPRALVSCRRMRSARGGARRRSGRRRATEDGPTPARGQAVVIASCRRAGPRRPCAARVVRAPRARPPDWRARLRSLPTARRPRPLTEALRRAAGWVVLLGMRARGRPHRVRGAWRWHGRPGRDLDALTFRELTGRVRDELAVARTPGR